MQITERNEEGTRISRLAASPFARKTLGKETARSLLRHEQHEDVIQSFGVDFSEKFCSDLPVNRCEGDRD